MRVNNFRQLKKFLFVLFVAATVFTGCQKDTSTAVKIGASDMATVNGQLKGLWLFPVEVKRLWILQVRHLHLLSIFRLQRCSSTAVLK